MNKLRRGISNGVTNTLYKPVRKNTFEELHLIFNKLINFIKNKLYK